ncbi:hypothetical protein A2767_01455 [Candidatus Roizmanbacteria bacterium RIFCSPHIGHO2_01_FULL_35_10]|uniref:Fido domain-containing protein n=1 Tax=Candidatus Roizmanbacteria bacterium RIFCSPLOWO2_01_FULL_35_13 TaxID=1802055 RepID=A0A1F7IAY4_9BACT|nr:MAG: hypothetical protein A2767_01455 [Candidatus Roizmanbacteria bacterium RIFCSPHIGHO2_01_FULL_35_10]OGK40500.1 MAG: hypothetical protein A3A74_02820 [Candidatus Roizmanbacteria bacterium RIFCSPLOWO2_01_FULL_35_13]
MNNPFIPVKLPIKIDYQPLLTQITKSHREIAKLDALLSQLINPQLLERTLLTKEAVMSSQIEGTQATINDVFKYEAKGDIKQESKKDMDIQEIINYRKTLEKGVSLLDKRPISENFIKELHRALLQSVRGHNKAPGEFRRNIVYIAKPGAPVEEAKFIPPPPTLIPELFSNLERYINSDAEHDSLVQIAVAHYQFEAIHPFMDGNGRIGRLIISLFLFDKKLLSYPYLYLSEYFEINREEYYQLLRNVSLKNEWFNWILFFLKGLEEQAKKAQILAQKINNLYNSIDEKMPELRSVYASSFFHALFKQPIFTSRSIRKVIKFKNNQTLFDLIAKFQKADLIKELTSNQKRNKMYMFKKLINLIQT